MNNDVVVYNMCTIEIKCDYDLILNGSVTEWVQTSLNHHHGVGMEYYLYTQDTQM